jgi:hypothetical protein
MDFSHVMKKIRNNISKSGKNNAEAPVVEKYVNGKRNPVVPRNKNCNTCVARHTFCNITKMQLTRHLVSTRICFIGC